MHCTYTKKEKNSLDMNNSKSIKDKNKLNNKKKKHFHLLRVVRKKKTRIKVKIPKAPK